MLHSAFQWNIDGIRNAHLIVTATFLHTAHVELSALATSRDVSAARNLVIQKQGMSNAMHEMIAPLQKGGRRTKVDGAKELGFDLGREIEAAVEDVGVFVRVR